MVTSIGSLLIICYEYPPIGGGAGNACYNYAKEFAKQGIQVTVLTSTLASEKKENCNQKNLRIIKLNCLRKHKDRSSLFEILLFNLQATFYLLFNLRKINPDYALIFFAIPFGSIGLILKQLFNVDYSLFIRGADIPGFLNSLDALHEVLSPLSKEIFRHATNIFANGMQLQELTEDFLFKHQIQSKVTVINNGVDCKVFKSTKRGSHREHIKLLFVGRLAQEQKNIFILHEILAELLKSKTENQTIELKIIGDGPDRLKLEKSFANLKTSNKAQIKFHGWLDKKELALAYQEADILLLPSFIEGLSNVVLEAMASGLYILASDLLDNKNILAKYPKAKIINGDAKDYTSAINDATEHNLINTQIPESLVRELSWTNASRNLLSRLA